jgi:hypothetical protein
MQHATTMILWLCSFMFTLNRESKQYIYNCVIEDCKDYYYIYRTDPERALGVFALKDNKASKRKSDKVREERPKN